MKIKKNDTILVITGKDKGKRGKVLRVLPKQGRVVVEGVNMIKKHRRKKTEREKGQIIELPAAIDASNVKIICSKCGQPARIGYQVTERGKYRICKKCRQEI